MGIKGRLNKVRGYLKAYYILLLISLNAHREGKKLTLRITKVGRGRPKGSKNRSPRKDKGKRRGRRARQGGTRI